MSDAPKTTADQRAARNARMRAQRQDPAHRARVAANREARKRTQAAVYEGRVLDMLDRLRNGGGQPLVEADFKALPGYWRIARIEAKKPDAHLLIVDGKVLPCDVAALAGGACP